MVVWSTSLASGERVTVFVVGAVGSSDEVSGRSSSGRSSSRLKYSAMVCALPGRRRDEHDDLLDVLEVAEAVERQLEPLAAQQQHALLGGLARVDLAVHPQAAHLVQDALLVVDLDRAALLGGLAHRDEQRDALVGDVVGVDLDQLLALVAVGAGDVARRSPWRPAGRRVVGFHDDHAGPSLLGRDADDGDRDADERGDADGDQRAGHELKARRVLGGPRGGHGGSAGGLGGARAAGRGRGPRRSRRTRRRRRRAAAAARWTRAAARPDRAWAACPPDPRGACCSSLLSSDSLIPWARCSRRGRR